MEHVGCTKALVYPKFSHLSTLTMETKVIIFICFVLLLIVGAWYCLKWLREDLDKRLYIYPKTEHIYLPIYRCKLKCPSTGEWFDAIIYEGVEDERYYVRERKEFFDKFVKLKDWRNGSNK